MAAEEIIFKVGVDTGNSVNDLNKVEKELGDIDKAASGIGTDVAARFDALNKKVASGTMNMREAQKAVKEYQTIALQAGRESPIGQQAIAAAGELKDTIGDLRTEITNAGTDGASMQAALQLGSSVAAGYGVMQGTMALLGSESEELEKSMQKLMAVQTLLSSVEQIRSALEKESFLMMKARALQTQVMTALETVYTAAVGGTTGAMKALRLAMLALPIVAIIAGVTALVSLFMSMESEGAKVTAAFKKQGDAAEDYRKSLAKANEEQNKSLNANLKRLDQEAARRKAMGEDAIKVQKEINAQKIKELEIAIQQDAAAVRALNAQKEKLKLSQEQAKLEIAQMIRQEYMAWAGSVTDIQKAYHMKEINKLGEELKNIDKESNEQIGDINEQLKARTSELKAQREAVIDLKTEQIDLNRQQGEKAAENRKKAEEEAKRIAEEQKQTQAELDAAQAKYDQEFADQLAKEFQQKQALFDAEIAALHAKLDEEMRLEEEAAEKKKQLEKEVAEAKKQIAFDALDLISNVTELFGKKNEKSAKIAFNVDKAAKISSATMAGIEGTINAYKTAQGSPITGVFPAYPAIQAGLAAAFAATNIAKIAQTQFSGSSGGGSQASVPAPSQGVPSVPTPEVNANTTLTAGLPGAGSQAGNKVYVLDSEITAQQTMSQKVTSLATFGG
jgi:hypothetical protein